MGESFNTVCPHCGQINRIPAGKPAQEASCGACGELLFDGRPHEVDAAKFQRCLEKDDIPLVVDFWAQWCGPCRSMAPAFAEVAAALSPRARFLKVNVDEQQALAARYGVQSIPALFVFAKGAVRAQIAGALPATQLRNWVEQAL